MLVGPLRLAGRRRQRSSATRGLKLRKPEVSVRGIASDLEHRSLEAREKFGVRNFQSSDNFRAELRGAGSMTLRCVST